MGAARGGSRDAGTVTLGQEDRDALFRLVGERGEGVLAAELKISRQTLARAAGGLRVQRATASVVAAWLAEERRRATTKKAKKGGGDG